VNDTSELKLGNYTSSISDATSLANIDGQYFTIVAVERRDYDTELGVMFTTKETFEVDGEPYSKFYTTRIAVVGKFLNDGKSNPDSRGAFTQLANDINSGNTLKVKCESVRSEKSKKNYFTLVE
jgi:hypothetical protein